jgi:putative transposase
MKINKAYKFRMYPTKKQIQFLEGTFNACRYVYNISLDCEQQLYQLGCKSNLSAFGLSYHLTNYKISSPWLKNYDALALEFEMHNLAAAFEKFFKNGGYPKFKSKKEPRQSFRTRTNGNNIKLFENSIKIPKLITPIEIVKHRDIEGKIKQLTIYKKNDKFYVSIMTETEKEIPIITSNNEVGVDLGLNHFAILDNGEKIENPKFLKGELEYLAKLQKKVSLVKNGSNNHKKLKRKISELHETIKNKRELFLHETSKKLVSKYDTFYFEDLYVKGMTASAKGTSEKHGKNVKQKSGLNRSILDVSFGNFLNMMEYKTKFDGKTLIKVNRFFPSSKNCSNCGEKNTGLVLKDRFWSCSSCGFQHDRDVNAAKNIKKEGRKILISKK